MHCCDDRATTLQVATAYFAAASEVIVAELDERALDVEVKREAPAPPDGPGGSWLRRGLRVALRSAPGAFPSARVPPLPPSSAMTS